MNTLSVSRLALALAFGVTLSACSSTPPDQILPIKPRTAPPRAQFCRQMKRKTSLRRAILPPDAEYRPWSPSPITLPAQPDFVVGPAGTPGVTHTSIQAAVDAAMVKRTNKRQYIAIMPGDYQGTVYVPAAPGSLTLYGTGEKPIDVKIGMAIDGEMSVADWRRAVNPGGKYMQVNPHGICSITAKANTPQRSV